MQFDPTEHTHPIKVPLYGDYKNSKPQVGTFKSVARGHPTRADQLLRKFQLAGAFPIGC